MNKHVIPVVTPALALTGALAGTLIANGSLFVAAVVVVAVAAPAAIISVLASIGRREGAGVAIQTDKHGEVTIIVDGQPLEAVARAELVLEPGQSPDLNIILHIEHIEASILSARTLSVAGRGEEARDILRKMKAEIATIESQLDALSAHASK